MSTTLAEKLSFVQTSLARAAAELQSSQTVTAEAISQEAGGAAPPAPPVGYKATLGGGETSVVLEWTDPPENMDAYQLEGLPALAADATTYTVTGLAPGVFTCPRLRRLGAAENSEWVDATPATITIPSDIQIPTPQPGDYPGPPQGAVTVDATADFSKLGPGVYAVRSGVRTTDLLGLKVGVQLWAQKLGGVRYTKAGLAFNLFGNTLAGFYFAGIGRGVSHTDLVANDYAGGLVGDNSVLQWVTIEKATGVGAAFGYMGAGNKVQKAMNAKALRCIFTNCGGAGFGGKVENGEIAYNTFNGNNATVGGTDGAGGGKATRCFKLVVHDNTILNSTGTAWWFDIENSQCSFINNTIDGVRTLKDTFRQRGLVFEWSMGGPFTIQGNTFRNCAIPIVLEETGATGGVFILDNTIYPVVDRDKDVACEIHLRDYYKNRSNWTPEKRLAKVTIQGNTRADKKPLRLARSGSGDRFKFADLTAKMGFTIKDKVVATNF